MKKTRFGSPPVLDETSNNLGQPEHAPASPNPELPVQIEPVKKTDRTVPFGLKVSREFKKVEDGLKLVELL